MNHPKKHPLRFRQIHLDFHTSGLIPGVGSKFSKRKFQMALRDSCVDSITLFSKCHHGFSYHPTKVGTMHPTLKRNLLAEQIEACRAIDVRCPIYLSAGLDEVTADAHPDWVVKNKEGTTFVPMGKPGFRVLRWNTPYLRYLCDQIEEVNAIWPDNDGIFLDIIGPRLDYSDDSIREMLEAGFDPGSDADVQAHAANVLNDYYERTTASALKGNPRRPVFHNSGNIPVGARELLAFNSHLEMESLPTGGWGWDHFPLTARYAQTTGYDYLGMTGKFHTTWGEFGGYKRAASLQYECSTMLSLGAKCSIGDQLHPSGEMNPDTYRLVGEAYRQVAEKQPWCQDVRPVARIGLLSSAKNQKSLRFFSDVNYSDEGAARMLLELQLPFVVLDDRAEWSGLDLMVLPDDILLTLSLLKRLRAFLKMGGKVVASGCSLLNEERTAFAVDAGATLRGRNPFDTSYLTPTDASPRVPVRSPLVIHGGSWDATPKKGTTILASKSDPYFDRSWKAFCSHQHTPDEKPSRFPAATVTRQIAWFAHDLFARYRHYGQPLYRDYFESALRHLLSEGLPVESNMPSGGRTGIMHQPSQKRFVVHLLFATPAIRGGKPHEWVPQIEILEELIPLHDIACKIQIPKKIRSASLVPEGIPIAFKQEMGFLSLVIDKLVGHQMIELAYA
jgi:Hypothetical glycosyl hydrolase 6